MRRIRIPPLPAPGHLRREEDSSATPADLRDQHWPLGTNQVQCCKRVCLEARVKNRRVILLSNKDLLNSDNNLFNETQRQTGIEYVYWHLPANSIRYPVTFTFDITRISIVYVQIISSRVLSSGLVESTGVQLAVERVTGPGWRLRQPLIVKIRAPSFGVAMWINRTLSLMNLEEQSTWPIFSDGSTNIQSEWKPRGARDL